MATKRFEQRLQRDARLRRLTQRLLEEEVRSLNVKSEDPPPKKTIKKMSG